MGFPPRALENVVMDRAFWQGRRVLITGHTGFKGGWLSLWLQHLGADVVGYALAPPSTPNLFAVAGVADGIKSIIGDIRNLDGLRSIVCEHRSEVVFHLAAQSLVRASYADPVETYGTNVMGTVHVLEAARASSSVKVLVNVTSDKCYDNIERVKAYCESDPVGGRDPYSSSKGCAELVTAAYRDSFFSGSADGLALASARAGNVIGGGDWAADRLVPDFVRAVGRRQPLRVRNPNAIRPWQHVLDPLSGYLLLAERLWQDGPRHMQAWNFGPDVVDAKPVNWIVERLIALWGEGARWEIDATLHPHEAQSLMLDSSKARARLGWRPRWTIDEAMASVVVWYKAHRDKRPMKSVAIDQITAYSKSN